MLKYIISSYYWIKALAAYEVSDYLNVTYYLSKINQKIIAKNYKYFLLRSLCSIYIEEYRFALSMVNHAEYLINKYHKNKISIDTYNYLIFYVNHLKLSLNKLMGIDYINEINNDFNIKNVDRRILHIFPIDIQS